MVKFWYWVYNIFLLPLFWFTLKIVSLFNEKAKIGIRGRKETNKNIEKILPKIDSENTKKVIIHCSSLGEYQQSLPLVEQLLLKKYTIIITFFLLPDITMLNFQITTFSNSIFLLTQYLKLENFLIY